MKLRLKVGLLASVCLTLAVFDEPLLVTEREPEVDLTDEQATAVLLSDHGYAFEVVEPEVVVAKAPKVPKAPKAPDSPVDLSGVAETTGEAI